MIPGVYLSRKTMSDRPGYVAVGGGMDIGIGRQPMECVWH
jgi:hypothetical protein